ncbi:MAG: hypothetical protein LBH14_03650 [Desulfobulbaceae bacterium]|jgi:hypothetical protein|nr:hypothetical protein [Desulfobulbaceae bacterium]
MKAETIEKILEISQRSPIFLDGRNFDSATMKPIMPAMPETMHVSSLQGVVDFVNFEFPEDKKHLAFLLDADAVQVVSDLMPPEWRRRIYLQAVSPSPNHFFKVDIAVTDAICWLQTGFMPSPDRDHIIAMISHLKGGTSITVSDDGLSQRAAVKSGITRTGTEDVRNILQLRPFQTFCEIEQPEVSCLIRLKEDGDNFKIKITQADGGRWKIAARAAIAAWLREKLPEIPVIA